MPQIEMYQSIANHERIFYGRAEYLEYLRARQRERQAWVRLQSGRARALERLNGVRELQDWREVEDFINDHSRDIDLLTDSDHQFSDFKLMIDREEMAKLSYRHCPVTMPDYDPEADDAIGHLPAFKGKYQHRYRRQVALEGREKAKAKHKDRRNHRERYDLPWRSSPFHSHTDVLDEIGIHSDGGGGGGLYIYHTVLFTQDFDHLRVMMRLAA